ncbi:MAG: glycosyltransferase family 10 [Phycisphaerae bacterium]|jgi:hypothetical protein
MLVRIIKNWGWPDLARQTPGGSNRWDGIDFTLEPVAVCDYVVVLNSVREELTVQCPPEHVWAMIQEPPVRYHVGLHKGQPAFRRVYMTKPSLKGPRYIHSHTALPWWVNRSYDELVVCPVPEKTRDLSWITSNNRHLPGHRLRMQFLANIQKSIRFDLFGRGFHFIEDKWDGLAPYRYSLAIENYSGPDYWTEKLADCYLAWSMPIYYGCTNIETYFPPESMVRIDITRPDVADQIRQTLSSDLWRQRRDAIAEARQLILNKYQLFPFLAREIRAQQETGTAEASRPSPVLLRPRRKNPLASLGRKLLGVLKPGT